MVQPIRLKRSKIEDGTSGGKAFANNFSSTSNAMSNALNSRQNREIKQEGIDARKASRDLDLAELEADSNNELETPAQNESEPSVSSSNVLAKQKEAESRIKDEELLKEETNTQQDSSASPTETEPAINTADSWLPAISKIAQSLQDGNLTQTQKEDLAKSGRLKQYEAELKNRQKIKNKASFYENNYGNTPQEARAKALMDIDEQKKIQDIWVKGNKEERLKIQQQNNVVGATAFSILNAGEQAETPEEAEALRKEAYSKFYKQLLKSDRDNNTKHSLEVPEEYNYAWLNEQLAKASEFQKFAQESSANTIKNKREVAAEETKHINSLKTARLEHANALEKDRKKSEAPKTIEMAGQDYQVTKITSGKNAGSYKVEKKGKHVNKKTGGTGTGGLKASDLNYLMKRSASQLGGKYDSLTDMVTGLDDTTIGTFNELQTLAVKIAINNDLDMATAFDQAAKKLNLLTTKSAQDSKNIENNPKNGDKKMKDGKLTHVYSAKKGKWLPVN